MHEEQQEGISRLGLKESQAILLKSVHKHSTIGLFLHHGL